MTPEELAEIERDPRAFVQGGSHRTRLVGEVRVLSARITELEAPGDRPGGRPEGCDEVGLSKPPHERTLADIIGVLRKIYTEDQAAQWLYRALIGGQRAIALCVTLKGRELVYEYAVRLVDGEFSPGA